MGLTLHPNELDFGQSLKKLESWGMENCGDYRKRYIGHLAEGKTISSGEIWIAVDRNAQFTFEKLPRL